MKQQLVISAIGTYQPETLSRLTKTIRDCGANILDCRMELLGNEASITILLTGSWDAIAKIEGLDKKLEKELSVRLYIKRTEIRVPEKQRVPYSIEIVSGYKNGVINEVTEFLNKNEIHICEFYTNSYQNPYTDMTLLSIHMTVSIPSDSSITMVRSEFLEFCDRLNLDAIMEPVKAL
jgi:glycine cleavage system transcriptional repressor